MIARPMLAVAGDSIPTGPHWTYEVKWDGYRSLAIKTGGKVRLLSRNLKNLTDSYPGIVTAVLRLKSSDVVVDGEIVALDAQGRPSFQALQHRRTADLALVYYAFDVLRLDGQPLINERLEERRRRLETLLQPPIPPILISEPLPGAPSDIEREIRRLGLEGIVAKRRDSTYRPGERSDAWVKVKFSPRQEFVIGGYKAAGANFDSILVGYYNDRQLYFAGKVRAGFTPHLRNEVFRQIGNQHPRRCPFANLPNSTGKGHWGEGITEADMTTLKWVKPTIVVEVAFVEWSVDGLLRHSHFIGIRTDKSASQVHRRDGLGIG
jgi:DNA ligase D-like protein (predicted ligase)